MLTVTIPDYEGFNQETQEFISVKGATLQLEHSLISLKKWEQKWHVPFLQNENKTSAQILDYIRCMTINPGVDPRLYYVIPPNIVKTITDYINDPMTATWFNDKTKSDGKIGAQNKKGEIVTAEIIYYWMISLNVPVEFQKWHLNSLLTLIRVINVKNGPAQKMNQKEWARQRSALNAARRAKHHSAG